MNLKTADIIKATKGRLLTDGCNKPVSGISTDSRKITEGCLFIPLAGDHFDGHDYIESAFKKGAVSALAQKGSPGVKAIEDLAGKTVIEVECTLQALGDLANFWRRRFPTTVIAITGSNGKTSTKEMAFSILKRELKTIRSPGNWNNLIGVPLSLFQLNGNQDAAIIEMGMSEKGEIKRLAEIAEPQIGIITNIGPSHLENFSSMDEIKTAKGELFDHLGPEDTAIINHNDKWVMELAASTRAKTISFGLKRGNIRAENLSDNDTYGMEYDLIIDGEKTHIKTNRPGRQFFSNDLAAASIAHVMGLSTNTIKKGLESSLPVEGRMEKITAGSVTIINDAYNANPVSMKAALNALSGITKYSHRIAVLGDMLELGKDSGKFHSELGETAAGSKLDHLFLIGSFSGSTKKGAVNAGLAENKISIFEDLSSLKTCLAEHIQKGDVILVKGSRRMQLERIVESIKANWT